jgi:hypothetical protein
LKLLSAIFNEKQGITKFDITIRSIELYSCTSFET